MNKQTYKWAIIGDGPAGITAVGVILDYGVSTKEILWVDPEFKVGDFAKHWQNIPSNTKVGLFQKYLNSCQSFDFKKSSEFELFSLDVDKTCYLAKMAEPLIWVSNHLQTKVRSANDFIESCEMQDNCWQLKGKQN